uniref:Methyltransferase type 11 domain-containing protein n=1 Tax=Kalanchoe fedtschenkoi TaxID=63787 RepID=A0A7N0V4M5_KALFE
MFTLRSSSPASFPPPSGNPSRSSKNSRVNRDKLHPISLSVSAPLRSERSGTEAEVSARGSNVCICGRRHLIGAAATSFLPARSSCASDYEEALNRIRPSRPDWYEEMFATAMDASMKPYEAEVAGYKSRLFAELKEKAENVLELGIGTGPNLKYYAGARGNAAGLHVIGVDPNVKMEKYAKAAATAAGLQLANFDFRQAVGEALPLADASVDGVVGTLVLCSVGDVNRTLSGTSSSPDPHTQVETKVKITSYHQLQSATLP